MTRHQSQSDHRAPGQSCSGALTCAIDGAAFMHGFQLAFAFSAGTSILAIVCSSPRGTEPRPVGRSEAVEESGLAPVRQESTWIGRRTRVRIGDELTLIDKPGDFGFVEQGAYHPWTDTPNW